MRPRYKDPPNVKHASFSNREKESARREGKILLLGIMTENVCNLRCTDCFSSSGDIKGPISRLSLQEVENLVKEAHSLGARTIRVSGEGEPFLSKIFMDNSSGTISFPLLDIADKYNIGVVVFTNGTLLTESVCKKLVGREVSFVVKFEGPPDVFEALSGNRGYYTKEMYVPYQGLMIPVNIKNLLESGFANSPTRLAIATLIKKENLQYLPSMYSWARENNVIPYFCIPRRVGRSDYFDQISPAQAKDLFYVLLSIDH